MREAPYHLTRASLSDLKTYIWPKSLRLGRDHGPFLLIFAGLALLWFLGRWAGAYPFPFLWGDASNLVSFAVARDHPEFFSGDSVLGDSRNVSVYPTIHIPIIRGLARVTGDYGMAFISLLGVHVFLQALGFYLLGLVIFQSRYWGALLAVLTLMPVYITLPEFWGAYEDPLPRFSFQALLPFLLAGAFAWRRRPEVWPWLMAVAGMLIYVHPVSAPLWGFAIWLGMWTFHPGSWSSRKRLGYQLLLAAIFVSATIPFLLHYLGSFARGVPDGATYEDIYRIIDIHFGRGFLDIPTAVKDFLSEMLWAPRIIYWTLALIGTVLLARLRPQTREGIRLIGLWTAGLLTVSVAVPWIERVIFRAYKAIPLEFDLIRGIRYLIPIALLLCLWPFAEFARSFKNRATRAVLLIVGTLLVVTWAALHPPIVALRTAYCWTQAKLVCKPQTWMGMAEVLEAVRQLTPSGSTILPTSSLSKASMALRIRYFAHRPVVHSWRDGGLLAHSNRAALVEWFEREERLQEIETEKDPYVKLKSLVAFGRRLGASYLVIDFPVDPQLAHAVGADLIWTDTWMRRSPLSGPRQISYGLLRVLPSNVD